LLGAYKGLKQKNKLRTFKFYS